MKREVNMRHGNNKNVEKKDDKNIKSDTIITDPMGSWTGVVTDNIYDEPVQDVDDL